MDDWVLRLVVVAGVTAVALGISFATRAMQRPSHRRIDLAATDLPNGFVVFTSSDCANCAAARQALQDAGVPFREVTWELEARVFEVAGVESVPLVVARRDDGSWVGQIVGVPRPGRLRRLVAQAR